tara:strand:+ start:1177 stop:4497 length:3321 start_codon:yes stop_codon:yes gene_type:complete
MVQKLISLNVGIVKLFLVIIFLFFTKDIFAQDSTEYFYQRGMDHLSKGENLNAINFLKAAYELRPESRDVNTNLGHVFLLENDTKNAEFYILKAIMIDSTSWIFNRGDYYNLSCIYSKESRFDEAFHFLEKSIFYGWWNYDHLMKDPDLKNIRSSEKFDSFVIRNFPITFRDIDKSYSDSEKLANQGDYAEAVTLLKKTIKLEKGSANPRPHRLYTAHMSLYVIFELMEKYESKIQPLEQALFYSKVLGLKIQQAHHLRDRALLACWIEENCEKGIEYAKEAASIYETHKIQYDLADINRAIGTYYLDYSIDDPHLGIPFFRKSLEIWREEKESSEIVRVLKLLASSLKKINELDNSIKCYRELVDLSAQRKDLKTGFNSLVELSEIYQTLDDLHTATEFYKKARETLLLGTSRKVFSPDDIISLTIQSLNLGLKGGFGNNWESDLFIIGNWPIIKEYFSNRDLNDALFDTLFYSMFFDWAEMFNSISRESELKDPKIQKILLSFFNKYGIPFHEKSEDEIEFLLMGGWLLEPLLKNLSYLPDNKVPPCVMIQKAIGEFISKDMEGKIGEAVKTLSDSERYLEGCYDNNMKIEYYSYLAKYHLEHGALSAGEELINKIIQILDKVKQKTPLDYRTIYFEKHLNLFGKLSERYYFEKQHPKAIMVYESIRLREMMQSLGKHLATTSISGGFDSIVPNIEEKTILYYTISPGFEKDMTDIFFVCYLIDKGKIYSKMLSSEGWANDSGSELNSEVIKIDPNSGIKYLNELVRMYLYTLKHSHIESKEYSKLLYKYLIAPFEDRIVAGSDLVIIPNHFLSFLPFETLLDSKDIYLGEKTDISYVQSLSVLSKLVQKKKKTNIGNVLAVGGAIYNTEPISLKKNIQNNDLQLIEEQVYYSINTREPLNEYYAELLDAKFTNLPGSYNEVVSIKKILGNVDLLIGEDANENMIKQLSKNGRLSDYNIIHFATHAIVMNDIPELSAIVLTQTDADSNDDGYLTLSEISILEIDANFVNLSACETGLGQVSISEGVLGMTQAFLQAGAVSISVSLWPIDDKATSLFMKTFYKKIANGEDYSGSISDTKREFISGEYGEEYKKPYYWAPFVYYGK